MLDHGEKVSLIAGGPPCPGFSLIGRSKISNLIKHKKGSYKDNKEWRHRFIDDPRNNLFLEFVKYVKQFKPDYFIMENVSFGIRRSHQPASCEARLAQLVHTCNNAGSTPTLLDC